MARCEDFPCCGHEMGCCPRYDDEGRMMHMTCTCGAPLPVSSRFSICESCMNAEEIGPGVYRHRTPEQVWDEGDQWLGGYGADEDWEVAYWRKRALDAEATSRGEARPPADKQRAVRQSCNTCHGTGIDPWEGFACDCPAGAEWE